MANLVSVWMISLHFIQENQSQRLKTNTIKSKTLYPKQPKISL